MTGQLTPEAAKALRTPFPKSTVGILPKPYKKESPKGQCKDCGGYHGLPAVHLDYVGHAAVTDRLLTVDPEWSWEPFAVDGQGLPAVDKAGNLWIKLTVCGVTRIGVGDGQSAKEAIGDAIRNAAMRFGVALDLWSKEELESAHDTPATPPPLAPSEPAQEPPAHRVAPPLAQAKARVWLAAERIVAGKDERQKWIRQAITERGYNGDSVADLNDLAAELEAGQAA